MVHREGSPRVASDALSIPKPQKGRGKNMRLMTLSFDVYSIELLRELAPSRKALGSTLCALVQAEVARRRERQARQLEAAH